MKNTVDPASFHGTYTLVTRDVQVTVTPKFLEERSDVDSDVYVFIYEVTIENHGNENIQLLNRHWLVMSGGAQYSDVKGDGVVGEQPVLKPGDGFTYASFTVIDEPVGSMLGSYTFRSENGEFFDVTIPEFDLVFIESAQIH